MVFEGAGGGCVAGMQWGLSGMQRVCVGVGLTQFVLLVCFYFYEARADGEFVSKELEREVTFKLLLTLTVLAQICISGFYLYDWGEDAFDWRLWLAGGGMGVALCGWCVVDSTVMETAEHVVGTCLFLGGTALYAAMMISVAPGRWSGLFLSGMYTVTAGLAIAFLVTHVMGAIVASATVEWLGFMAQAAFFATFFALHSFKDEPWPRARGVELSPLLHATGQQSEVASGLI